MSTTSGTSLGAGMAREAFWKSTRHPCGHAFDLNRFDAWFQERMEAHRFTIEQIPFSRLDSRALL
jgi:hypothetical protein